MLKRTVPVKLRLIGDTHGDLAPIREAVGKGHPVIHLGDVGFAHAWRQASGFPDFFVVAGNHDDYAVAPTAPCYLGDFGDLGSRVDGAEGVWFVRGANSPDRKWRVEGEDWWSVEELDEAQAAVALAAYCAARPHTVLSHDCPISVARMLLPGAASTRTGEFLQTMLEAHSPVRWYFAHWHVRWSGQLGPTSFRALAIDEVLEIDAQP